MNHKWLVVVALVCLFNSGISLAADYKKWIPYFPDKMDGLKAESKTDGINMDMGGQKISSLTVTYRGGEKSIKASIMHDDSGQIEAQQSMLMMSMETPDLVVKQIEIDGYKAVYNDDKVGKRVNIMLFFNGKAMLVFDADGGKKEAHYVDLVRKIDLKKIQATF